MEVGQILHNNPVGTEVPEYVRAFLFHIRREIARVYWNVNQEYWAEDPDAPDSFDSEAPLSYEPGIPGIEWRPYYNWGGCPDDADWDQSKANAPSFKFESVEIRWYKRFGRSMNVNVQKTAEEWVGWFDRCMDAVAVYEERSNEITPEQWAQLDVAARECSACRKFFKWPAERCGYCAQPLIVGHQRFAMER